MQIRFALLAPALFASAIAITASLSAQDKPADKPADKPSDKPAQSAPGTPESVPAPSASGEKPTAASVLERGASALGGKDAWAKIKSVEMKAQLELPGQNIKGPIQTYMASPAKMVTVINFAGIARTLVAVGTDSDASMLCTTRLATPLKGSMRAADGEEISCNGLATGCAGVGAGDCAGRTTCCMTCCGCDGATG